MDTIILQGMQFYGYHGCLPEEQRNGQPFYVDAVLGTDLAAAGASDALSDTIDYSRVYACIQEIVEKNTYQLIERLAEVIADTVLAQFAVDAVTITVHKPHAPIGGSIQDVAVTIERKRHAHVLSELRR